MGETGAAASESFGACAAWKEVRCGASVNCRGERTSGTLNDCGSDGAETAVGAKPTGLEAASAESAGTAGASGRSSGRGAGLNSPAWADSKGAPSALLKGLAGMPGSATGVAGCSKARRGPVSLSLRWPAESRAETCLAVSACSVGAGLGASAASSGKVNGLFLATLSSPPTFFDSPSWAAARGPVAPAGTGGAAAA